MADNREELNKRRQERRARERARKKRRQLLGRVLIAVMMITLVAVGILMLTPSGGDRPDTPNQGNVSLEETAPSGDPEPTKAQEDEEHPATVIHVAAAGDLVVNDTTVAAGKTETGYDYTQVFMDVAPVLSDADLTLLNFEGNLLGVPYGTETTSAPAELPLALKAAGVDLVQMANSTAITDGVASLKTTLAALRQTGLEPMGAYADSQEFQKYKGYTLVNVQGIRIALVAFTKGMNSLSLPAGSENCVNLLYTDYATTYQNIDKAGINAILANVEKEKPDLTIALVHWGSEYKDMVTKSQENIAKLMKEGGVDVVLGTHPHMLHEIKYDELTGNLVAYSLGDFFGEADRAGTDYSIILDLEITKDGVSGETKVTGFSYTPIYTLTEETSPNGYRQVVQLDKALKAYEDQFVDRVSDEVYEDMAYALGRIQARTEPNKTN